MIETINKKNTTYIYQWLRRYQRVKVRARFREGSRGGTCGRFYWATNYEFFVKIEIFSLNKIQFMLLLSRFDLP